MAKTAPSTSASVGGFFAGARRCAIAAFSTGPTDGSSSDFDFDQLSATRLNCSAIAARALSTSSGGSFAGERRRAYMRRRSVSGHAVGPVATSLDEVARFGASGSAVDGDTTSDVVGAAAVAIGGVLGR